MHRQGLEVNAYRAHPAALDAATHFGAVFDTEAGEAARVPVQVEAFNAGNAHQAC